MRIRTQPAVGFVVLLFIAGYLGLAPNQIPEYKGSDKVLHFLTFFILTLCFYWTIETNRRRTLQLTIAVCPALLGIGSEFIQAALPNGRTFDLYDIVANILGSGLAIALSTWYHLRMLERKRQAKGYQPAPGEEEDLELGERVGSPAAPRAPTLEEEVDNWDENAEDWEEDEHVTGETLAGAADEGGALPQKRSD
ncbi:hypothetical protein P152DRAFT_439599 [Eremomyces bilateralis CBS 781.70]|uniref:VanZ-like domain-containing protein n=1 Tax=Eremomyces bilateralis CBS 781.70 TaxID=1392243 RepID=A0A6G1FY42_9PEZI|nr:uncharacterized protein P152DRAFT_439599 [Eremomyces bilateralis CBS 781.70]KAF1810632.1 hypothetical protein P152DRAFT_439599 [Eremomyces bilateralis CBS 781.70]